MAEVRAATVAAEVVPAGVVGHQHDDVGFLVLGLQGSACSDERGRGCQQGQTVTDYFGSIFHLVLGLLVGVSIFLELLKAGFIVLREIFRLVVGERSAPGLRRRLSARPRT
jgi:hypothetical protein